MVEVSNIEVFNIEGALRGMRNPLNSWSKSDSHYCKDNAVQCLDCPHYNEQDDMCDLEDATANPYIIGEKDMDLMKRLYVAGTEHRKYLRQIFISMDAVGPLYWFKELETYKVGTTSNSCSTMHTLTKRPLREEDFSLDYVKKTGAMDAFRAYLKIMNDCREVFTYFGKYQDKMDPNIDKKDVWYALIQLLPSSYNQRRTITMSYENAINIIHQRSGHKLTDDWGPFVKALKDLPYIQDLLDAEEEVKK